MLASINHRGTAQDAVYWLQETRKEDSPGCSMLASINEEGGQPRMQYVGFNKRGRRTAQDAVCWLQ